MHNVQATRSEGPVACISQPSRITRGLERSCSCGMLRSTLCLAREMMSRDPFRSKIKFDVPHHGLHASSLNVPILLVPSVFMLQVALGHSRGASPRRCVLQILVSDDSRLHRRRIQSQRTCRCSWALALPTNALMRASAPTGTLRRAALSSTASRDAPRNVVGWSTARWHADSEARRERRC
ncbi:hypothetical protein CERSUDRAFT_118345 [Gelatoporia subvermispora B]|uniref:Uncharacterized protein n=1 Tax=Ceriporiopsis subvermispora (strain B) TaxID=914234 RepID=M2R3Y5_CERS8|nr:hypothetical protein CERSUDRAFT_118345 [Gelatoporia subvermispora B]